MKKPLAHRLQAQINELQRQLRNHQDKKCRHLKATGIHRSNTGNYDPHADCYWISCYCPTCLKHWSVDSRDPSYRDTLDSVEIVKEHRIVKVEAEA